MEHSSPPAVRLRELTRRLHEIGRDVVAPHAAAVDRDARFPHEAFAALKAERLLSCFVPEAYGGMGLHFSELTRLCEVLGLYCGSTAMVFAMHQIQVGCVVHHATGSPVFEDLLRELCREQLVMASATTELGIGGDVRTSRCAVRVEGDRYLLEKQAPVISYADHADIILVTARRAPDAAPGDQVHVMVRRSECTLEPLSTWDTLGFRGTCSIGYTLRAEGPVSNILPVPYAEIHQKTMHPFSHIVWSALWLGIATDAVQRARASVRAEARKTPGTLPPSAMRLAELDTVLFTMRSGVEAVLADYQARLHRFAGEPFPSDYGFSLRVSNLKVTASTLIIEIVGKAMLIAGITGYRNDAPGSLCRHLRDAYGASLMVSNERILGQSSTMQILHREG
jgi:acyl-CoA dehydrogenase